MLSEAAQDALGRGQERRAILDDPALGLRADLQVGRDLDQDGVSDAGELLSLEALGIVSLSLSGTVSAANDNQAIVLLAA